MIMSSMSPNPTGPARFRTSSGQKAIPKEDMTPSPLGPKASSASVLGMRLSQTSRNQALGNIPGAGKKKRLSLQDRLMSSV